jgi:ATP-dependent Lon protease
VKLDASQLIWVATANDARAIPEPILNRCNVHEIEAPDFEAARGIALRLYQRIRAAHDWGKRFVETPGDEVLDQMAKLPPREMRRAWMTGFGNAKLAGRDQVSRADLPPPDAGRKRPIGF